MTAMELDGSMGGGQLLRSALALSVRSGRPFRMTGIRGQRAKPGLMRQHLTCVNAAAAIASADVDGAALGSTTLTFHPGAARSGDYHFPIGTGGSVTLLAQCLLPMLWGAEGRSRLILEGGAYNPMAPPFDFFERCYLGALKRMGVGMHARLKRIGFASHGGGCMEIEIPGDEAPRRFEWNRREEPTEFGIRVIGRNLSPQILRRIGESARKTLDWSEDRVVLDYGVGAPGAGVCALVEASRDGYTSISSSVGEMRVSAERVGARAAKGMMDFLSSEAPVCRYLADQLILPLSLGQGGGFVTMHPTTHLRTHAALIQMFLGYRIEIQELETAPGRWRVTICPV